MQALDFSIRELDRKTDHFCDDERQHLNMIRNFVDCSWPLCPVALPVSHVRRALPHVHPLSIARLRTAANGPHYS